MPLTQQIYSLHLKNPLVKNVKYLLVCLPFSLESIANPELMSQMTYACSKLSLKKLTAKSR